MDWPLFCGTRGRAEETGPRRPARLKEMARPKGSGNRFRHGDVDHRQLIEETYGGDLYAIAAMRKKHIRSKKGCHVCAAAIEDRLFGKPQQELPASRAAVVPIVLVSVQGPVPMIEAEAKFLPEAEIVEVGEPEEELEEVGDTAEADT